MEQKEQQELQENHVSNVRKRKHRFRINRRLLALKFLIFVMNGATSVLYPFFILHCLAIGLTLTESGIVFALIPVFGSVGNPLAGFLADKLGDYKKVVIFFTFLSVLCHALLGFAVPVYSKKTISQFENISTATLEVGCLQRHSAESSDHSFWPHINFNTSPNFTVDTTHTSRLKSTIKIWNITDCKNACDPDESICFTRNYTVFRRCIYWTDIKNSHFFLKPSAIPVDNLEFLNASILFDFRVPFEQPENQTFLLCPKEVHSSYCGVTCELTTDPVLSVSNRTEISGDRVTTFMLYTLFRVVGAMAVSSVMMLIDAGTLMMVKEHNGDFGIQRFFGIIGSLVFPPLGGKLVGIASKTNKRDDYSPIFYLFCAMFSVGAVVTWVMDLHIKPPGKQIWSNIWKLMGNVKVSSFVIVMFLVGCFYGILENYLFWFMEKFLESSKWLCGMTNTVAGLSALPVVALSSYIVRFCGHTKIFMLSLVLYGVRFLAYSFVYDPYLILPVEILEALTFSLTWVVATMYSGKVAPAFVATLQGLIGAMHYSVGRGVGSLVAGTLFDHYPPRRVYQMVSGASVGCGVMYAILHYAWLRHAPDPKTTSLRPEDTVDDVNTNSKETTPTISADEDGLKEEQDDPSPDEIQLALMEISHPYLEPCMPTTPDHDNHATRRRHATDAHIPDDEMYHFRKMF